LSPGRRAFPLIPRARLVGTPFGERRSSRRGRGADVAGSRPYLPGDPVSTIDWYASARLSAARGSDEFVVRELYLEESPRVVVVADRRPSMALYPSGLPWLSKPAAVRAAAEAIAGAARAARSELGYADVAGGRPHIVSPGAIPSRRMLERLDGAGYDAPATGLDAVLAELARRRSELPYGSFVFVLSDFLVGMSATIWSRLRRARLDVVPVIVQDPTWEQSFPPVHGVVVPFADPGGEQAPTRLTRSETAIRRRGNEERLATLLRRFRRLAFDPVVLGSEAPAAVEAAFLRWAERRRARRRRQ
jgi:uncharacterized protein (DUF58 family)